ncbi:hypothetical protein EDB86DRAFT_2962443 [Lactarius hatsudake]|nr:hypothetical protein EDB86DRAFT_2962443 [Lactarius hatsudake]
MKQFYLNMAVVKTDWAGFRIRFELLHALSEQGSDVSFSNVENKNIAPFVNLDHVRRFTDATPFDLRRSRIPTKLFRDIVLWTFC